MLLPIDKSIGIYNAEFQTKNYILDVDNRYESIFMEKCSMFLFKKNIFKVNMLHVRMFVVEVSKSR